MIHDDKICTGKRMHRRITLFFIVYLFLLVSFFLETLDQPTSKEAVTVNRLFE